LEQALITLRELLRESGLQILTPPGEIAPERSKSAEALTASAVVVTLVTTAIRPFASALKEWLSLREKRMLELKFPDGTSLKLSGPVSTMDAEQLIKQLTALLNDAHGR
jgi:hypothetical protein